MHKKQQTLHTRKEGIWMLKRLEMMASLFVKIATGILFVTAVYISVFYGWNQEIQVEILWQILVLAAICTLGSVLLPVEGKKEVSKSSMLIRVILYFIYINIVVLFFGNIFEWFMFSNRKQLLGMIAAIVFVFLAVMAFSYWIGYKEAERINQKLKEREYSKEIQ